MPKSRTVIRWQRKQPVPPGTYPVKNVMKKSEGLSDLASWLETSTPENMLDDLRNYQDEWCAHVYAQIAIIQKGGKVIQYLCCEHCGHITTHSRAQTSG